MDSHSHVGAGKETFVGKRVALEYKYREN